MTTREKRPRQSWLAWDTHPERERRADAYREAFRKAFPGGSKVWQSRPTAPGPGSEENQAHRELVLAAGRAGVALREVPGGVRLAHRIRWKEWFGEELEDEPEEVLPAGPPEMEAAP